MRRFIKQGLLILAVTLSNHVTAGIISEFTSISDFNAAVGPYSTIDFQGLSNGTLVTTQFSGLGATFTDGNDTVSASPNFVTDSIGLTGNGDIRIEFSSLVDSFGVEFPGALQFDLFIGGSLVGSSSDFGGAGTGFFGGTVSTSFDSVVLRDFVDGQVFVDNIHFGNASTVPEPVSLLLLSLGLFGICFSRKTSN